MANDIYIKKSEIIGGVEKTTFQKLSDMPDEFQSILNICKTLDFALVGIYGNTSTSFLYIPVQVMVPKMSDLGDFTKIEAKYVIDYETGGASTAEYQLFNYTDLEVVTDSISAMPNQTFGHGASGWIDITAYEGKALRLGNKRVGGTGSNSIKTEGAVLLLKFSKV